MRYEPALKKTTLLVEKTSEYMLKKKQLFRRKHDKVSPE